MLSSPLFFLVAPTRVQIFLLRPPTHLTACLSSSAVVVLHGVGQRLLGVETRGDARVRVGHRRSRLRPASGELHTGGLRSQSGESRPGMFGITTDHDLTRVRSSTTSMRDYLLVHVSFSRWFPVPRPLCCSYWRYTSIVFSILLT